MEIVWTEFARAGLAKNVPAHARGPAERWINAHLRTEPWLAGKPTPVSPTARAGSLVAGGYVRFLFDFDDQRVRVLSISRDTIIERL